MNREEAVPAPDKWYGTIDKAVEYLQECKRNGQNVYIEFNGNKLYSCDATLDSAYLQITGLTKEESDKVQEELSEATTIKDGKIYTDEEKEKEIVEKYKKIEQKHIEEAKKVATPAPDKWYGTIDKAVEYLQECKRNGQNVYIEFNGNKLYSCDATLDSAYLQITGLTKEESDKVQEELSEATTIKDGKIYTDEEKEKEIVEKYKKIEQKHIEEAKKVATPAERTYLENIKNAVAYLQECKKNGQNVYVDFNGHKLYSCDVTLDSAYMEVVGMTKEEDEAIRAEYSQAETEEEKKAIIAKWDSIRKAHAEAGDKEENKTVLDSAIKATEEKTKTSTINGQAQGIRDVSKGKDEKDEKTEETEIVE